jgi:hypothetical protein
MGLSISEREVRLTLAAIERELAATMAGPVRQAGSRIIRLRVLLVAVQSTNMALGDALAELRGQLEHPPPPLE